MQFDGKYVFVQNLYNSTIVLFERINITFWIIEESSQVIHGNPRKDALFLARENARIQRLVRERVDASIEHDAVDGVHHGRGLVLLQKAHTLRR